LKKQEKEEEKKGSTGGKANPGQAPNVVVLRVLWGLACPTGLFCIEL
jgi:hypothetical protein